MGQSQTKDQAPVSEPAPVQPPVSESAQNPEKSPEELVLEDPSIVVKDPILAYKLWEKYGSMIKKLLTGKEKRKSFGKSRSKKPKDKFRKRKSKKIR